MKKELTNASERHPDTLMVRAALRISEWVKERYAEHLIRKIRRAAERRKRCPGS